LSSSVQNAPQIGLIMLRIALAFFLTLHFGNIAFGQGVQFRWKLTPGTKLVSEVVQEMEQSPPGTTKPVTQKTEITQLWEVKDRNGDGTAQIVTVLQRARLSMDIPGAGAVEMDTDKAEDFGFAKQIGQMFRPMIGVQCTNSMAPNGKISNVVIPDDALKGFRSIPLGSSMEPVLKDSIEKGSPVFPDTPIVPGHTWTQVTETKNDAGVLESTNQYKYIGSVPFEGRPIHQFNVTTKMAFKGENRFKAKISVPSQDIQGKLWFDNENGYLVVSELNQNMTMNIEVPDQPLVEQKVVQRMKTGFKPEKK
jgi:hypothetical protein